MTTTLIPSTSNRLGLEVTHVRCSSDGTERLRAYQCGKLVAARAVERHDGRAIGDCIGFAVDAKFSSEERAEITRALDEGVRILRDGRGLCEAA